jgi:hypothetical protein
VGWSLIGLLWSLAAYLVVHYAAVVFIGPQRLHAVLGERVYNALVPPGGFPMLVFIGLAVGVWVVPFAAAFGVIWLLLRAFPHATRRRRAWAAAVVAAGVTVALPFIMLDSWPWALMPLVWEDDTEFAPGYSALGFWLVRPGMSRAEVVAQIGAPLRRDPPREAGEEVWRWTRSPHDSSYRERIVVFRNGHVAEKHSEFWVD